MSTELIRAVYVKSDGVYLYSKSNNDDRPFHEWKCGSLTDVYKNEGQQGLDREMVRMFCEYAKIQGHHKSVERYRPCLRHGGWETLESLLLPEIAKLTPEDLATLLLPESRQTDGAKAYKAFRCNAENELYEKLAQFADKVPHRKIPLRDTGAR